MPETSESGGETTSSYLEKIRPKDLVMFSSKTREIIAKVSNKCGAFFFSNISNSCFYFWKNDFNFLENEYDLNLSSKEDESKIRIWGFPQLKLWDPIPLGILTGFTIGGAYNRYFRKRPFFTSMVWYVFFFIFLRILVK